MKFGEDNMNEEYSYSSKEIYLRKNNQINELNKKLVYVIVYVDENEKKYLDVDTIVALVNATKFIKYEFPDGQTNILSESTLINKGSPKGAISSERVIPDLSSILPYDEEFDLYELTEEQIYELVDYFKKINPHLEVEFERRDIKHSLSNNNDKLDQIEKNINSDKLKKVIDEIIKDYKNDISKDEIDYDKDSLLNNFHNKH